MPFDYDKNRAFWEERAKTRPFQNILLTAMLHDDNSLAAEHRDRSEKNHFFSLLKIDRSMEVLDLGGGSGRWALELARKARRVTLVDFSSGLLDLARQSARQLSLSNIDFIESSIVDFSTDKTFDLIFISGALMYHQDEDLPGIARKCFSLLKMGGRLVLREGIGLNRRIEETDRHLEGSRCGYSAFWRTSEDYVRIFKDGLILEHAKPSSICPIAVYLFKKILPIQIKKQQTFQNALKIFLKAQEYCDPVLLKYNLGWRAYKFLVRLTLAPTMSQFFVFKKC